jgi:hypothetical protein
MLFVYDSLFNCVIWLDEFFHCREIEADSGESLNTLDCSCYLI